MNLDFILFSAPRAKYNFVDFWGETIFIPNFRPVASKPPPKTTLLGPLTNCYRANKSTEVYFSIESALS